MLSTVIAHWPDSVASPNILSMSTPVHVTQRDRGSNHYIIDSSREGQLDQRKTINE